MQHTQLVPASDYCLNHSVSLLRHEPTYLNHINSKGPYDLGKDRSIGDGPYIRVGARGSQEDLGDGGIAATDQHAVTQHKCAQMVPLPRMLSDRIPVEVIEQIAYHLAPISDGTQTILSMTTVCASWYPSCQRVLYRDVALYNWDGYTKLAALAVERVDVRRRLACTRSLLVGGPGLEAHCLPSFPLVFAGMMPSLVKLDLRNLHPPFHPNFCRALPTSAPSRILPCSISM